MVHSVPPMVLILVGVVCGLGRAASGAEFPMPITTADTTLERWLQKPVAASRLLDDMESTNHWRHAGRGEMLFTTDRAKDGRQSVRLRSPTKTGQPSANGRPFGECVVRREVAGENWQDFNRLSVWVYPHLPGFKVISFLIKLRNEGAEKVPDNYGREGLNYVVLEPDRWNQVVWEIPHLARDRVTGVELIYRLQGHEPGATNQVCFDLDRLELQRVEADHFEGWEVAPGRIAYNHAGYSPRSRKVALASNLAGEFKLVNASTGKAVLSKSIQATNTAVGTFALLDFSEWTTPGEYRLEAGGRQTRVFSIQETNWLPSIWKTLNLFYCERCGTAIPRIHDACHQDWRAEHDGRVLPIYGGWHDAGDLSQGLVNTAESTYALLALAQRLTEASNAGWREASLVPRMLAEASWGLAWLDKTRFGDGARVTWATMDFWTDGVVGTPDDMTVRANNSAYDNFVAAATEALAARVLRVSHPILASNALAIARADFGFAERKIGQPGLELAAAAAHASIELFKATQEPAYREAAVRWAEVITNCQQRVFTTWEAPWVGFFYTGPKRERLLHYAHRGHEQAPVAALSELCRVFPEHPGWMDWYATVALHSEYLARLAHFTEPYGMLCASIYSLKESNDPRFQAQVRQGIRLADDYYLRRFPVWFDFRGNSGTMLSQAKALSVAGRLRQQGNLLVLAERQLQWHVGLNPFCQSLLFGEGHEYAPQYTAMSGDMVGSLPVGIQTRANADLPYWPAANCYNYKEVWVHPSARWAAILSDLIEPARPEGSRPSLQLSLAQKAGGTGKVEVHVRVRGTGQHRVGLRTCNLQGTPPELEVDLNAQREKVLTWETEPIRTDSPWMVVALPDGQIDQLQELTGGWPWPIAQP